MSLIRLLYARHRFFIATAMLLSIASAALGIAVMAMINERLLAAPALDLADLGRFGGLLLATFVVGSLAQIVMSTLGHKVVYRLRQTMVKRVLDTGIERLEDLGLPRILATLSGDINKITLAFASLPSVVYGLTLTLGGFGYLAWLSPRLFVATAALLMLAVAGGGLLMARTRREAELARELEDELYRHYQAVVEGRKELALNRDRARHVYEQEFEIDARRSRDREILTDVFNGLNQNWVNTMLLTTIGVALFLADYLNWASAGIVSTFAFTLMFLRAPLTGLVGAIPSLISGSVALAKVESLQLAEYHEDFDRLPELLPRQWTQLRLEGVEYRYRGASADEPGFAVGPIDLQVRRGELLFVVGGNGSGKTTLMRLLSGLYRPQQGRVCIDEIEIDDTRRPALRTMFASVFSDFYLFRSVLGHDGKHADEELGDTLLTTLQLEHKVSIDRGKLSDVRLSQGQRKRLALLLAWAEQRPILLLDEWAADQDPAFRDFFYHHLLPELRSSGKTIVAVSHDDRYFHLADRVLKLDSGRLVDWREPGVQLPATLPQELTA
ncbi:multidrug ABC transporter permease/ATP-binding protein [Lysobacter pythonis]|uniref:Multidrug ABC transporter permease/ATP-binding protein n=1 Tax=Solilutibacter pythonis TaxID=2483112 RepID=A0A3M2HQ45_9GAMM|nr:multidrug ABC transporter permease/ATP-binding protein [Lysobacter pythonis]RMH88387.1 multidrug ABC transporter permease/ATP-binding protein [Lysobacter pythonis]